MGGWLMERLFTKPRVAAISACVSKNRLELSTLAELYGESTVTKIMKVTGIRRVSIAPQGTTTADYCAAAAVKLMREQDVDPQTVDGLVFVTETPDYIIPHTFYTDGSRAEHLMIPAGANRVPHTSGVTDILHTDADGNARTDEDFYMNGLEVMGFALNETLSSIRETAERMNWELSEVDLFALHQANALIVQYITKQLKLPKARVPIAVGETGNASSASIPIMLTSTFGGKTLDFAKVLVCGFGTGLACAGAALDLSGTQVFELMEA